MRSQVLAYEIKTRYTGTTNFLNHTDAALKSRGADKTDGRSIE